LITSVFGLAGVAVAGRAVVAGSAFGVWSCACFSALSKLSNAPPILVPTPFAGPAAVAAAPAPAPYSTTVCAAAAPSYANNPSTHPESNQAVRIVATFRS
jgi:hypothetical protein